MGSILRSGRIGPQSFLVLVISYFDSDILQMRIFQKSTTNNKKRRCLEKFKKLILQIETYSFCTDFILTCKVTSFLCWPGGLCDRLRWKVEFETKATNKRTKVLNRLSSSVFHLGLSFLLLRSSLKIPIFTSYVLFIPQSPVSLAWDSSLHF